MVTMMLYSSPPISSSDSQVAVTGSDGWYFQLSLGEILGVPQGTKTGKTMEKMVVSHDFTWDNGGLT